MHKTNDDWREKIYKSAVENFEKNGKDKIVDKIEK